MADAPYHPGRLRNIMLDGDKLPAGVPGLGTNTPCMSALMAKLALRMPW